MNTLPLIFAGIIAFCVLMYVILDGFTLGTGMMMGFLIPGERDIAMSVILPNWDGNQTWLVLGMASLYGAFPIAFSTLLPILYVPLMTMVIALLFRGVVFEFRLKSDAGQQRWDILFFVACLVVTFIQGSILGNVIYGFDHSYQWITPYSLLTSIVLIIGYALLGSTRLILKTTGNIQSKMRMVSRFLTPLFAFLLIGVSFATFHLEPALHRVWINHSNQYVIALLPFLAALSLLMLWIGLLRDWERVPYWSLVVIFLTGFAGFGLDIFPYVVPYELTIQQAASPHSALVFLLVGAAIMLPVLLIYTGYSYHIFRGKTQEVIHY